MIIGLTGQIGSGKSTAASVLADLGAIVIDADRIGREVVENSSALLRKLAAVFGAGILDRQGRLKRSELARLAFVDDESRDRLNQLVHPHLLKELRRQVKQAAAENAVVVIDAALLLYWGMDKEVDLVLVIHAGRAIRLERLRARGIAPEDARSREKAQLPYSEFRSRADRLILNNGSPNDLKRRVTVFFKRLSGAAH